ncbi:MAG TPA: FliH/SctL family protein [Acidobacteriaceae bacterium]
MSSSVYDFALPVSALSYRDVGSPAFPGEQQSGVKHDAPVVAPGIPAQEVEEMLARARAEAIAETEKRLSEQMEARSLDDATKVVRTLDQFAVQQKTYFSSLENEVVHLALAIAGRILHREAQVDTMLVAGLVHVALEKLQNGSNVTVRVGPNEGAKWRTYVADLKKEMNISVIEDSDLAPRDCVLETELGSADFSIESQLKEVERGFLDLLALRPPSK